MNQRQFAGHVMISLVIAAAIAAGVWSVVRIDSSGEAGNRLGKEFAYELNDYRRIDPAMIGWAEKATIPLKMHEPRVIAVGLDDSVVVAGDKTVCLHKADGTKTGGIALGDEPSCLAVAGRGHVSPGRIYVGLQDHVEVFEPDGEKVAVWKVPDGKRTMLTSIAVGEEEVFVADAGALLVWRYDVHGKLLGSIGKRDESRNIPGFVVPSPYFDVATAPDGLLRVANPGCHRVEAFTVEGDLEASWGKSGMAVEGFCGCCNPSHLAVFADGRVVTSEKGIVRVKLYGGDGVFRNVVVGPETLAPMASEAAPPDVAVNSQGQVLVLDTKASCVRVYQEKSRQ